MSSKLLVSSTAAIAALTRLPLIAAAFSLGVFLQETQAADYEPSDWQRNASNQIKSYGAVEDVLWTQSISLWVSVRDDGSSRDGLAETMCLELHDAGMPDGAFAVVTIWNHLEMLSGNLDQIGKAECRG